MRTFKLFLLFSITGVISALPSRAVESSGGSLQASNLLNPNISAIGWIQAESGHRHATPGVDAPDPLALKEVELAVQSVVDPYSKADLIMSVTKDGMDVEEGTLTWYALPHDLALKVGKFRANFGRFNRVHPGETAFADRPLAADAFLGADGLAGTGASLSWQIPNPWLFLNLDVEGMTAPTTDPSSAFNRGPRSNLLYVSRLGGYVDLTEASNVTFGSSLALGPAGQEMNVDQSSSTLQSRLVGVDMTFRWKNPRHSIYRSFLWQSEANWGDRDVTSTDTQKSFGVFSQVEYQFAQRWRVGTRYDYTQHPTDHTLSDQGGMVYLTFMPSEFSLISLQGRHVHCSDGINENIAFVKTTFSVGPHGAHPF